MISENDIIFDNLASEVFPYLDELRRSEELDVFEYPIYVQDDFNVDKNMAMKLVSAWFNQFEPEFTETDHPEYGSSLKVLSIETKDPEVHEHPLGTGFAQKDNK